jgi:hypothetical protein
LGTAAAGKISQLLDHDCEAGSVSAHHGGLGLWLDGRFLFSTGRQSRKARNLAKNQHCIVCTEHADQAVIVEGIAGDTRDIAMRRAFLKRYQRKYDFDMSGFEADILSLKEPVYAVRPALAFGLDEKKFLNAATRWRFKT